MQLLRKLATEVTVSKDNEIETTEIQLIMNDDGESDGMQRFFQFFNF